MSAILMPDPANCCMRHWLHHLAGSGINMADITVFAKAKM
jgi:hypothetical protein